jgi:hypothetical protein
VLDWEIVGGALALCLALDYFFSGLFVGLIPRWLGIESWYRGLDSKERRIHNGYAGGLYLGFRITPLNVIVTDARLIVRIGWSHQALVDVPIGAIRRVTLSKWWWSPTVVVEYRVAERDRSIQLTVSSDQQRQLVAALRSAGVGEVEGS